MNAGILKSCDFYRNRFKMPLSCKWKICTFLFENILVCVNAATWFPKKLEKIRKDRYSVSAKMNWIVDTRPGKKFVPFRQKLTALYNESIKNYIFPDSERHAYRLVYTLAQVAFSSFIFEAFFLCPNQFIYILYFFSIGRKKVYCMHKVLYPSNNANKPIRRKPISACTILTK